MNEIKRTEVPRSEFIRTSLVGGAMRKVNLESNTPGSKQGPVGPTYVITVPENYTDQEMNQILDLAFTAADEVIGHAIVVREGVHFTKISDEVTTNQDHYEERFKMVDLENWAYKEKDSEDLEES